MFDWFPSHFAVLEKIVKKKNARKTLNRLKVSIITNNVNISFMANTPDFKRYRLKFFRATMISISHLYTSE